MKEGGDFLYKVFKLQIGYVNQIALRKIETYLLFTHETFFLS